MLVQGLMMMMRHALAKPFLKRIEIVWELCPFNLVTETIFIQK